MVPQHESPQLSTPTRTGRDVIRKSNPRRVTIDDLRHRDVFAVPARGTR